jgi:predicted aldo/keto reductase-like oxidoreductase
MKYRKLGPLDVEVSALGFGAMRLPTVNDGKDVDEPKTVEMIRRAIDEGVNYVDSAWPYHGGQSETAVGAALTDGYRQRVYVATKLPVWDVKQLDDCDRFLDEQLRRLRTDRIDFYLLHCLNQQRWPAMRDLGVLDWAERARSDGRIGEIGFSYHDSLDVFREVVDAYDWSLCQIQYNYVCEDVQAGTAGLKYAAEKGLAVVTMEPLFGGTLAAPPEPVRAILDEAPAQHSPVELALRWLWNQPEVSLVLSGMSTMDQVRDNVATAGRSEVGSMSADELSLVARMAQCYRELAPIPCTKCRYCCPCPNGVNIPGNFELYNNATVQRGGSFGLCKNLYIQQPEDQRAAACVQCGECEPKCPQGIGIGDWMTRVDEKFT